MSRVLTGLWQIADMERDGGVVDRAAAVRAMQAYAAAGFTSFDMADHYGSAEEIAGQFAATPGAPRAELLTKWVPKPGPLTREDVRAAVSLGPALACRCRASTSCSSMPGATPTPRGSTPSSGSTSCGARGSSATSA